MMIPKQLLKYHDAQLYESDIHLFGPYQWLNDNIINFYFQYLYHDFLNAPKQISFMDPAVVSCMMLQCDDKEDFQDLANGLQLEQKQIIFIPVNDNDHFGGGSSHWSLLIYHRDGNNYGHYDSSFGHNLNAAQNIARVFSRLLNINSETTADSSYAFESVQDAPQQHNGYDCGMYVLQIAEYFCRKWIDTNFQEKLSEFASPSRITSKRQEIPKLISTLVT